MKNQTYSTQDVLATAFAAYRKNSGYVKYTQRFSEPDNNTVFANKELVKYTFNSQWAPKDFVALEVTADDYDDATFALQHFKKYTLQLLAEELSGFQKDIMMSLSNDTVESNRLGALSYVPEMIKRDLEESKFKKLLRMEYRNSEYVGSVGDKVEGVVKILRAFYSTNWERWGYTADFKGNIVSFMSPATHKLGDHLRIRARVKGQVKNRSFSVNESRLNYVKVYKV